MILELEAFTLADPVFFDSERRWDDDTTDFVQTGGPIPAGWDRSEQEVWVVLSPEGHRLPEQGWKIHVSACLHNAARVLDTVYEYCVDNRVSFKFLRGHNVLRAHSLKYAERSSSGKLVTIYPAENGQLRTVLAELSSRLEGEPGPYILTDLRYGAGPLYVRYGAFVMRYCPGENGEPVPALTRPDGTLVPDRRRPVFTVPDFVQLPDFLAPHLAARDQGPVDFPYRPENALHFSNGGGVYLARRTTDDRRVVLKEGRPYAGVDMLGRDAVRRLRAERDALRRLAGIRGIPAVYEHRRVWEHEFLVEEHMPGDSLFQWLAEHHPLVRADATRDDIRHYTERALAVAAQVERILTECHARGVVVGDLHPNNVLIDEDDNIALIDLELTTDADSGTMHPMGFPGFKSRERVGPASDRYSLAALRLWLFLPIIELTALAPDKTGTLVAAIEERFDLPADYLAAIRAELLPPPSNPGSPVRSADLAPPGGEPDWDTIRKSMADAIVASATPDREDRLFPGDIQQFVTEGVGIGFGYGAAGVLWALDRAGAGRFPDLEEWLLAAVRRARIPRAGFFDGWYGLAFVLDHLGHAELAARALDRAVHLTPDLREVNLHSGLAGAGLSLLHFAARGGEVGLLDHAHEVAGRLAGAVRGGRAHGVDEVIGPYGTPIRHLGSRAGLLRGWSGPALFFLGLYRRTADPGYLDLAVESLHRDLDLCKPAPDDSLQVDAGYGLLPYLEIGSAGIALVAADVLRHREDARLAEALPRLVRACQPEVVFEVQLGMGRAGLMAALARLAAVRTDLDLGPAVRRHRERLTWHALSYHGKVAFPGAKLRRLSMDLTSGSAGVLLAIGAAVGGVTEFLPFLEGREPGHSPDDQHRPPEDGR